MFYILLYDSLMELVDVDSINDAVGRAEDEDEDSNDEGI